MKIEVVNVNQLASFRPRKDLTYVFLEGDDLEDLSDPSGSNWGYPEGTPICGNGYRIRSDKFISVDSGWVELIDLRTGVMIPGNLLDNTISDIPKGAFLDVWVTAWLRNKRLPVYTVPCSFPHGSPPKSAGASLRQLHECLRSLGCKPKMSILTPTYNRHSFLPRLAECVKAQETKSPLEWCVLDDSPEPMTDDSLNVIRNISGISLYYVWIPEKIPIGNKRNILSCMAVGDNCINFDDDDFHHPERIRHSIFRMEQKKADLVGSTRSLLYLKGVVYQIRGFGKNHSTGGLMAFSKEYARSHTFGEDIPNAEEAEFTNKFTNPLSQLNPDKVILIMSHARNTYDKTAWVERSLGKMVDPTKLSIGNFTKNKKLRRIFQEAFRHVV